MDFLKDKQIKVTEQKLNDFPKDFLEKNILQMVAQIIDMIQTSEEILTTLTLSKELGGDMPSPLADFPIRNERLVGLIDLMTSEMLNLDNAKKAYHSDKILNYNQKVELLNKYKPRQVDGLKKIMRKVRDTQAKSRKNKGNIN